MATEWKNSGKIKFALNKWIEYFKENYLRLALGHKSPNKFEETNKKSLRTLLMTARLKGSSTL